MSYIMNYGVHVRAHLFMFHVLGTLFTTFFKVTWNRFSILPYCFFFSLNLKCRRMFSILLILLVIYIIIAIIKSITVWFYSSHASFFSGKDTVWFFLWLPVLTAVQVEAYNSQDDKAEMPIYNLPPKILCEVVYAQLKVYIYSFFFNRQFCKIKINKSKLDPEWCLT